VYPGVNLESVVLVAWCPASPECSALSRSRSWALGAWRHRPVRNAARAACHSSNFLKSFDAQAARAQFSCRITNQLNQLMNVSNHPW
jgi:hypothetical protein